VTWSATWPAPVRSRPYVVAEFRAMASPCRIIAENQELAAAGESFVHELERRWSRFIPTSEIGVLNRADGSLCIVSPETMHLVQRAEFARLATDGVFNPLVLNRLDALMADVDRVSLSVSDQPIDLFTELCGIRLPRGAGFDPGGIGKGLAGDFVIELLSDLGATTAQVELGGDVRVLGENWTGGDWAVNVTDAVNRTDVIATISVSEGAVATSSVLAHRWERNGQQVHHLIDPATGMPSATDLVSVTAVSSELWWAEVVAKVALMAGLRDAPAVMRRHGATGLLIDRYDERHVV
jgi:FAD:protein FMN transferase